jgi:hypothetical protein
MRGHRVEVSTGTSRCSIICWWPDALGQPGGIRRLAAERP